MTILNKRNANTQKIVHIMVTTFCNRNCKFCCNKQYDLNDIPYATEEELRSAEIVCLTGGEPFQFSNPCEIANQLKRKYPNIKKVYVYTNALELANYLLEGKKIYSIDGVNVSIKVPYDAVMFDKFIATNSTITSLSSNLLYVFDRLYDRTPIGFTTFQREWQEDFTPAPDSIFRKL